MAPKDIAHENLTKMASKGEVAVKAVLAAKTIGDTAKSVGKYMLIGAGATAGAAAVATGASALHRGLTSGSRFKAMLKSNPDLRAMPEKDVREVFDIVHEYAPDLTKHPSVSGSFVRKAIEYKDVGVSPASVKELVDIQGARSKSHSYPTYPGMLRGLAQHAPMGD